VARRIVALAVVAVVALAALAIVLTRGGDKKAAPAGSQGRASARAEALAYVPAGAPAVVGVDTDSPTASLVFGALVRRISGGALTANDISPLLGNEAVVALLDPRTQRGQLSMVAKDPDALRALARRLRPTGSYRGAQLYAGPQGSAVAIKSATLLAASDQATVRRALDTKSDKTGNLTPRAFDRRLAGLSPAADVRAIFDPKRAVVRDSLPGVLNTRWGRSLTNGAAELTEGGPGIKVPFVLQTDAGRINALDLPFGTGARPPTIRGRAPLLIGVRDIARLISFLRRVEPRRFGGLNTLQGELPGFLGVNVNGLLNGLHGEGTISSADRLQHVAARTNPPDPNAWRTPLERLTTLSGILQRLGIENVKLDEEGANGYRLEVDNQLAARVALFGPTLVLTDDPRTNMRATATAPPAPTPPGARGGLTLRMTAAEGRRLLSSLFGLPANASAVVDRLGDLTGWARASTDSVRGELQLGLR